MERDDTINQIYKNIQIEYRRQYGIELTLDKIHEIVDSQFVKVPECIENCIEIKFDYFGKFTIKPGRVDAINNSKELKKAGITGEARIKAFQTFAKNKAVPVTTLSMIKKAIEEINTDNEIY